MLLIYMLSGQALVLQAGCGNISFLIDIPSLSIVQALFMNCKQPSQFVRV